MAQFGTYTPRVETERRIGVLRRGDDEHAGIGCSDEHPGISSQRPENLVLECLLLVLACEQAKTENRQDRPRVARRDPVVEEVANEPVLVLAERIVRIRPPALRETHDSRLWHRRRLVLGALGLFGRRLCRVVFFVQPFHVEGRLRLFNSLQKLFVFERLVREALETERDFHP